MTRARQYEGPNRPYTPWVALLGGEGVVQAGQSEVIGRTQDGGLLRSVSLVNAECESMYAAIMTVVLTATRFLPAASPGTENEGLPMFARVSFGNGGTQSTGQLEVDYINGAMFSLPAGFLRVDAVLEDSVPDDTLIGMNAAAFLGYYPLGKARQAQRTRVLGDVAAAAAVIVPVPFFATRFEVFSVVPGTTYTVEQLADAAGLVVLSSCTLPAPAPHLVVPLVNATRYVRLTNTAGVASGGTRAVFQLSV